MIDATGNPQTILLLGGTSDIGQAIVAEYLAKQPLRVVLAARPSEGRDAARDALLASGASAVDVLDFDATAFDTHAGVVDRAWEIADVDVAIVAFGLLGDAEQLW
ncbi:MAG: decaprenylphospho-beta-D-erythro-pentofuranosid-2-ulose 2-reductase, partial [Propionicimonas sp.]|nr:decaprenylphospho-beta-D-erythro-pentofuranosid-2-ulose 2-reductase [Propionicimonas sp.]